MAVPDGHAGRMLQFFEGADPTIRGSLYYDLAAGRRLEIETLNGTVVRLGRVRGVPTPANFAVYAALKPYAEGAPASWSHARASGAPGVRTGARFRPTSAC